METHLLVTKKLNTSATGCLDIYELSISGEGTKSECEFMKALYSRGCDLAVEEMNRQIAVDESNLSERKDGKRR